MTFKSGATLLCFFTICFTTNILHATLRIHINVKNEDYRECLRQTLFAFKSENTTECLKYAIEHYKKEEYIPVYESEITNFSNQSFPGQTSGSSNQNFPGPTSEQTPTFSSEDLSYIVNFDGFQNFIQNEVDNQSLVEETSNEQGDTNSEEIYEFPLNYAMAYFNYLETRLPTLKHGTNVMPAILYCDTVYKGDQNCKDSLEDFGDHRRSAKYALEVALTQFKLTKVTDEYIRAYMLYLIVNIKIKETKMTPRSFCDEIFSEKEWYLKLKGYDINNVDD